MCVIPEYVKTVEDDLNCYKKEYYNFDANTTVYVKCLWKYGQRTFGAYFLKFITKDGDSASYLGEKKKAEISNVTCFSKVLHLNANVKDKIITCVAEEDIRTNPMIYNQSVMFKYKSPIITTNKPRECGFNKIILIGGIVLIVLTAVAVICYYKMFYNKRRQPLNDNPVIIYESLMSKVKSLIGPAEEPQYDYPVYH